jgi:hypothetical protein
MATVLKTVIGASLSWVQIPAPPPLPRRKSLLGIWAIPGFGRVQLVGGSHGNVHRVGITIRRTLGRQLFLYFLMIKRKEAVSGVSNPSPLTH